MTPGTTARNHRDGRNADRKLISNFSCSASKEKQPFDRNDIRFNEFRHPMFRTLIHFGSKNSMAMQKIFLMRHIFEIFKAVVGRDAIFVVRLFPFRAWTHKSKQHKLVNSKPSDQTIFLKCCSQVTQFQLFRFQKRAAQPNHASYPSMVADFVEAFKSWHVFPSFHAWSIA